MAWVYIGVIGAGLVAAYRILQVKHPDLIQERSGFKEGSKSQDMVLARMGALFGPGFTLYVCGLDQRVEWTNLVPLHFSMIALAFMIAGYGLVLWAVASNKFFSPAVRIQTDRGHTVVTAGPYRIIRHPGYTGLIVILLSTPLILNSWMALIPSILTVGIIVFRTAMEDKTLIQELEGYKEYVSRSRYRLLPGIW
jgi:protein-S-isoprenylcysteine O-methyltransferase Ste14